MGEVKRLKCVRGHNQVMANQMGYWELIVDIVGMLLFLIFQFIEMTLFQNKKTARIIQNGKDKDNMKELLEIKKEKEQCLNRLERKKAKLRENKIV